MRLLATELINFKVILKDPSVVGVGVCVFYVGVGVRVHQLLLHFECQLETEVHSF